MILSLALLVAAADPPTIYDRIEQRIASDPAAIAALGRPAPQMREIGWLVGSWDVATELESRGGPPASGTSLVAPVLGGAWLKIRDSYGHGGQNLGYIGYSALDGRWLYVGINNLMSVTRAWGSSWVGNRVEFEGEFSMIGMTSHLRYTLERQGPDNFSIVQEERVGSGWRRLAVAYYHRRAAGP